jgi:hypothetical protein
VRSRLLALVVGLAGCSFQSSPLTLARTDAGALDAPLLADGAPLVDARIIDARAIDAPLAVDGPGAMDAAGKPDASLAPDAPPPPDAAPPPDAPDRTGVACGPFTCRAPSGVCCIDEGGPMPFRCEADTACPSNGTPHECDGPEDCNGFACCSIEGGGTVCTFLGIVCVGDEVCHEDKTCSGELTCCPEEPYDICRAEC